MPYTEIYVDPALDASPQIGDGSIGSPYSDLEHAIIQETFDVTNGTRVNIKAGTAEVLAANLLTALNDTSVSVAWGPWENRPLIFQGYTSAAGDGGMGSISGGGAVPILDETTTKPYVNFVDLELHNVGANEVLDLAAQCCVIRCEVHTASGIGGVNVSTGGVVADCYVHDVDGVAIGGLGLYINNHVVQGTGTITSAISMGSGSVIRNIVEVSGAADGILAGQDATVMHNAIYAAGAATGQGIYIVGNQVAARVTNNLIEGFSGAGGYGIKYSGGSATQVRVTGGNSVYDCATAFDPAGRAPVRDYGGDETLSVSPFTSASTGDFSPVDTGSVKEGALPQIIGGGLV